MRYSKNFLFVTRINALDLEIQETYEKLRSEGKITLRDIREIKNVIKMLIVRCLEHDRNSLRLLGDEKARIAYGK